MKKLKLAKLIVAPLIAASILAVKPMSAAAEWKYNSKGWLYSSDDSYYTGWKLIDKNWYYFYSDGYMAHDTTIDGAYLSSSGAWTNSMPPNSDSNLDSLGQSILSNISIENPSFYVEYTGSIDDAGKAVQDEIDNLKYINPYAAYNLSSYNMQLSSSSSSSTVKIKINCTYMMTAETEAALDTNVKSIVANIAPDSMSQSEKELAIHDWIVNNTQYDQSYTIYDPYNTLVKHAGVCEGYSLLAQKMFMVAGIKSLIVEGMGNGQSHSWNMIYIDGKWRHVDVTWDDPVSSIDILRYDYFNLTDSQISKDHTWNTSKYPKAN